MQLDTTDVTKVYQAGITAGATPDRSISACSPGSLIRGSGMILGDVVQIAGRTSRHQASGRSGRHQASIIGAHHRHTTPDMAARVVTAVEQRPVVVPATAEAALDQQP